MTVFTQTWNAAFEALPADGNNISEGAQRIRNHRKAVRERLEVDHSWAGDIYDGFHKKITVIERGSLPATPAASQAEITPLAMGSSTGFLVTDAEGLVHGLDGGVVSTSTSSTLTLTKASAEIQLVTPGAALDVDLPSAGIRAGRRFQISNVDGAFLMTVKASGGDTVGEILNSGYIFGVMALQDTPTDAAHWALLTGRLQQKLIEIGSWNMQSTSSVDVDHGLDYLGIRGLFVAIQSDSPGQWSSLTRQTFSSVDSLNTGYWIRSVNIRLFRPTTGLFVQDAYNDPAAQRGYLTVFFF